MLEFGSIDRLFQMILGWYRKTPGNKLLEVISGGPSACVIGFEELPIYQHFFGKQVTREREKEVWDNQSQLKKQAALLYNSQYTYF